MKTSNMFKVAAVQCGPALEDISKNIERNLDLIEKAATEKPDVILFSELSTMPYFCGITSNEYFKWAEPLSGSTIKAFSKAAKQYNINIITTFFEHARCGEYYNSAVIINRNGKIVPGILPSGEEVPAYRKNHLVLSNDLDDKLRTNEKFYFRPGPGFPIFKLENQLVGILICYDKRFVEGWRTLVLQGAEIIFNPVASWGNWKSSSYESEIKTMAINNGCFVVSCNKAGLEKYGYDRNFFGSSLIVDPFGEVLAKAPEAEADYIIQAELVLDRVRTARLNLPIMRDRRPEIYKTICCS